MRGLLRLLFILAPCLCVGCATQPSAIWSQWAHDQGGIVRCPDESRVSVALARLGNPRCPASGRNIQVKILASDHPCAFAWRDGTLFITAGLLQILDDREVTAVLAHELGHLQERVGGAAAFSGAGALACEMRADIAGCGLLRQAGLPPQLLGQALQKVRDDPRTASCYRQALTRRIEIIESQPSGPK